MTEAPSSTPPPESDTSWLTRLEPGETLLWQGRPDGRLMFLWSRLIETVMGLGFASGAVICLAMVFLLLPQLVALAVLPGVVFFTLAAFFFGFWPHYADAKRRQRTRYALTDRRAIIAQADRLGHVSLRSFPIHADSPLGGGYDRVIFATERQKWRGRSHDVDIAFERIGNEARAVYDHLLAIKTARRDEGA